MSEQTTTSEKKEVVKKTPEQLAEANGLKIYKSGLARGKTDTKSQSQDPLRKRLGVIVATVSGRKEKGKTATFKNIKTAFNGLDDVRGAKEDDVKAQELEYMKTKNLVEKSMLYLASLPVPKKKPTASKDEQPKPT